MAADVAVTVKDDGLFSITLTDWGCPLMVISGTSRKSLVLLESKSGIDAELVADK